VICPSLTMSKRKGLEDAANHPKQRKLDMMWNRGSRASAAAPTGQNLRQGSPPIMQPLHSIRNITADPLQRILDTPDVPIPGVNTPVVNHVASTKTHVPKPSGSNAKGYNVASTKTTPSKVSSAHAPVKPLAANTKSKADQPKASAAPHIAGTSCAAHCHHSAPVLQPKRNSDNLITEILPGWVGDHKEFAATPGKCYYDGCTTYQVDPSNHYWRHHDPFNPNKLPDFVPNKKSTKAWRKNIPADALDPKVAAIPEREFIWGEGYCHICRKSNARIKDHFMLHLKKKLSQIPAANSKDDQVPSTSSAALNVPGTSYAADPSKLAPDGKPKRNAAGNITQILIGWTGNHNELAKAGYCFICKAPQTNLHDHFRTQHDPTNPKRLPGYVPTPYARGWRTKITEELVMAAKSEEEFVWGAGDCYICDNPKPKPQSNTKRHYQWHLSEKDKDPKVNEIPDADPINLEDLIDGPGRCWRPGCDGKPVGSVKTHYRGCHLQEKSICPICGVSVKGVNGLWGHMKTHSGPHGCDQCEYKGRSKAAAESHIKRSPECKDEGAAPKPLSEEEFEGNFTLTSLKWLFE